MVECCKCGCNLTKENWYEWNAQYPHYICKECCRRKQHFSYLKNKEKRNRESRKWYVEHRKEMLELNKEMREKIRLEVLIHYGGNPPQCNCCNERRIEFLTIDNISGNGNQHRKNIGSGGGSSFYRWLKKNNFPFGFQVLCMNCNFSIGKYGYCPHKK